MANLLSLPAIEDLISEGGYGGRGFLQPSSAVIALSAALWLSDMTMWEGASYDLTEDEIDTILELVAQLESDLTETGDMYPIDKVSLTKSVAQSIPPTTDTTVSWDVELYDPQDMHSNVTNNSRIYAKRDGLHLIDLNILWQSGGTGDRKLRIYRWSPTLGQTFGLGVLQFTVPPSPDLSGFTYGMQTDMLEGDFVYVTAYHNSGAALDLIVSGSYPYFSAVRL